MIINNKRYDFNYYITKFFLSNNRLTILVLGFFVIVASIMTFSLKTTGFPSPSVGIVVVNTIYPGASSEVVNRDLTIPLEASIKAVKGVKRYTATSNNSVSTLSISVNEDANIDSVRNDLDAAVKSVKLPTTAQTPKLITPDIGGPALILAITAPNLETIFQNKEAAKTVLSQNSDVSGVEELQALHKQVVVRLDQAKLKENNLTIDIIQSKIATLNENLPVISNVSIDSKNVGFTTSLSKNTLEDLKNLSFNNVPAATIEGNAPTTPFGPGASKTVAAIAPKTLTPVKLSDLGEVKQEVSFVDNRPTYYTIQDKNSKDSVIPASILNVKFVKGVDQITTLNKIRDELKKIDNINYNDRYNIGDNYDATKNYLVEGYTEAEANKKQVNEVVSGLVGGPLKQLGGLSNLGWLLGGIQLVMLAMIAFVSWRAALVSALAIPLSFAFSTVYLYLTGQSLNTLTLFSLVLVTGLVVDPALVVLESIQRKIDSGLVGNEAVLDAICDVGPGVFLAMVTNIIVFVPFGILSGIFGQIFRYIPLTIIPATVGSYLVPLIVLAWFGGLILKKNKSTTDDEVQNLWPIARWVIGLNKRILHGPRIIRLMIIVVLLVIPIGLSGFMFSHGYIKQVQFATSDNSEQLFLTGSYLNQIPQNERDTTTKQVLDLVAKNPNVTNILPSLESFGFYTFLKPADQRSIIAKDIANDLNSQIQNKFGSSSGSNRKFYDVKVTLAQTGGPQSAYQVALAVKSENLDKLKAASLDAAAVLKDKVCFEKNQVSIKDGCSSDNKVILATDDGFTDRDNLVYDVQLDRDLLINKNLATPGRGPLTAAINQNLKNQFAINNNDKVATINIDDTNTDVIIAPQIAAPTTLDEVKTRIKDQTNENLDDLGKVVPTSPKSTIQRIRGQTTGLVQGRLKDEFANNQGLASQINVAVTNYYNDNNAQKATSLGLSKDSIQTFSDGQGSDAIKAFSQLGIALVLAIIATYIVLAVFFNSFLQPLSILYTIPLTFLGVFPALYYFVGGQFGFLEIIGLIILIGIVENAAIFLIDSANQRVRERGEDDKSAIANSSGLRFRPVLLTKVTAIASLAPLAITSDFYRSISVVIIFGLLASGFISLVTTPILYIFFKWLSKQYQRAFWLNKILFFGLFPIYIIVWGVKDKRISGN